MRFRVLGPVEVAVDAQRLRIGSARQRVVLGVLLAARGAPVSTDRLIDAVWEDAPPPTARRSLHSHVARLRRALVTTAGDATDPIVTDVNGYRLDLQDDELDAADFEVLVGRARALEDGDPQRAVASLDEALGLWRGPAFGELAEHPSVRAEAVRLDEMRAAAAADRVDLRLAIGDHQGIIGELEATVTTDPLDERSHRQLMLALYRDGRQADALTVYRRLRDTLREEIGVDPSPEVADLQERILRQDAGLQVSERTSATAAAAPGSADRDRLLGRDVDVATVATWLTPASLVTLTGPGGVGKSRLARAVIAATEAHFDEGVVVCELAAVRDPDSVPAALLEALVVQQQGGVAARDLIAGAVGTRRLLFVVDNCEHVLAAVSSLVEHLRHRCPNVAILATSREYLHLPGEQVWEVAPLPVPRAGATGTEVSATPAGALFCLRARQVEPSFRLTEDNAAIVAALCRRLDGIPLAIELAAARSRALALDALAERIDHRFEVLTGGAPGGAGRHRTLQAMVDWSYELLTDPEARLFDRLSVFAGAFGLDAVEHVCAGAPLAATELAGLLGELVDKSLVVVDRDAGQVRYRLLDTLRAYGATRLDRTADADAVRGVHATYHVELAERSGIEVAGNDERAAVAWLDTSLDDLRVAHEWLVTSRQIDLSLRLASALHDDLVFRPRSEVFAWADRALDLDGAEANAAAAGARATAARGAMNRGDLDRARDLTAQVLDTGEPPDRVTLWALYVLTTTALYEGRLGDALAVAERRVELAATLGLDYHRALAHVSRALVHLYRGDADVAVRAADEAQVAADASGNRTAQAWALYSQGEARLETDPDAAARLLEQAIAAARQVDRRFIEGVALVSLASLTGRRGRTARAVALFRETVAHWRRLGVHTQQLTTLRNLVELLVRIGVETPAATLHGAVTAGVTPTFGVEAERLATAWEELQDRLGPAAATAAAERGRSLSPAAMVDAALALLDELLAAQGPQGTVGKAPPPVRVVPPGP